MKSIILVTLLIVMQSLANERQWQQFKEIYKKNYDITNEKYRFNIFINNLKRIEKHKNRYQNGEVEYYIGVNQFADLTSEEFISRVTSPISDSFPANINNVVEVTDDVPDEIDWREKGAVLGVKNQLAGCKASWAFTATGVIEGQLAIQKKQNISLSEQHLIDCSTEYHYNRGCRDGNSDYALLFIHDHGICSEGDYPYTAKEGPCQNCSLVLESVAYPTRVLVNEISLKQIVGTVGPVAVALSVNENWQLYKGGIFDDSTCTGYSINYWALAVGYSAENGTDYWIVRNSLGESWGEDGYIRMIRGKQVCNINQQPWYALL
ncbi:cathepsin L-like proteinase [Diabrotica virgifera virgifera]|uniref:Cathepsin L-like proteinase n=2 Tax=Diabrotica virgifera virgifera TaxID=50390 RepID=A0ABM5JWW4_DIAVI|nr:cathepsin L-like proteinase [Diabrotica virgifera virgifera]